jgi:hypothetical protein
MDSFSEPLSNTNAVLHIQRGNVYVRAYVEGYVHGHPTIVGGICLHIAHARRTVHLRLDGRGNRLFDCLRISPSIGTRYLHNRGSDIRVLANRQTQQSKYT